MVASLNDIADDVEAVGLDAADLRAVLETADAGQHTDKLWVSGSAYDVVFDVAGGSAAALPPSPPSSRTCRAGRTGTTAI